MRDLQIGMPAWALLAAAVLVGGLSLGGPAYAMGGTEDAATECEPVEEGAEGAEAAAAEDCVEASEEAAEETGDDAAESPPATVITCPSGFKLTADGTNCELSSSGLIQELPAVGWNGADLAFVEAAVLAHSGEYERAIDAFTALGRPDDPYVLNYLGFSNRKLGNTEAALAYYHKALSIRPDYVRVREYLGEGYIALGRIDDAREQLALIADECGTACDEYRTLEASIAEYLTKANG